MLNKKIENNKLKNKKLKNKKVERLKNLNVEKNRSLTLLYLTQVSIIT